MLASEFRNETTYRSCCCIVTATALYNTSNLQNITLFLQKRGILINLSNNNRVQVAHSIYIRDLMLTATLILLGILAAVLAVIAVIAAATTRTAKQRLEGLRRRTIRRSHTRRHRPHLVIRRNTIR